MLPKNPWETFCIKKNRGTRPTGSLQGASWWAPYKVGQNRLIPSRMRRKALRRFPRQNDARFFHDHIYKRISFFSASKSRL
jgi:hypothetical protein